VSASRGSERLLTIYEERRIKSPRFFCRRSDAGVSSAETGVLLMHFKTIALLALVGATSVAEAAEVKLKFRLVTTDTSATLLPVKNVGGRTIGAHDAVGVAVFEDGRLAFKRSSTPTTGLKRRATSEGTVPTPSKTATHSRRSSRPTGVRKACRAPTRCCRGLAAMRGQPAPAPSGRPRSHGREQACSTAPSHWISPRPDASRGGGLQSSSTAGVVLVTSNFPASGHIEQCSKALQEALHAFKIERGILLTSPAAT